MALLRHTAARVVPAICALLGALMASGCGGGSPPHAAPAFPRAEPGNGEIALTWNAVTDASRYVILWTNTPDSDLTNEIKDLTETTYLHTGLTNLTTYRYRIVAQTGGGRGPKSNEVSAEPAPVPGEVEWTAVTSNDPGHTIYFAPATGATGYRVYFASTAVQLTGRRPLAFFEVATGSPHQREEVNVGTALYYRVIATSGTTNAGPVGFGGPIVISSTYQITTYDLPRLGAALGDPNADSCLDLVSAIGGISSTFCQGTFTARVLADAGLSDLVAAGRTNGDSRFADFTGDKRDDLFSNTLSAADDTASRALFHVNQGTGNYATDAGVTALGIGGFGGTLLAADFDNDNDIDLFAPNDDTRGDGARNWLLINDGAGVFTDGAVADVATNPPGADYVPHGGQAVDFNEDGRVDLLFGSRLLINNGNVAFSDGSVAANIPVRADQGLKLTDADLDGDLDLIHHDGAVTRLYRNTAGVFDDGTTTISEGTTIVPPSTTPEATFGFGLNACDVNGDGFEDVLIANNVTATGKGVPKLLVNVNGEFEASAIPDEIVKDSGDLIALNDLIACGDVDNSGVIDFVSRWGQTYRLLRVALTPLTGIRIRVLGSGGERNQQGHIVKIVPRLYPNRIMTRVIESGSGLQSQNQYDLLVGAPWLGHYDISVRFRNGVVNATADPGGSVTIFEDGRVETGLK
jgi:hypothetical protein